MIVLVVAGKIVPVADRLALVVTRPIDGASVTRFCAELGISRRLRDRYDADGIVGLVRLHGIVVRAGLQSRMRSAPV